MVFWRRDRGDARWSNRWTAIRPRFAVLGYSIHRSWIRFRRQGSDGSSGRQISKKMGSRLLPGVAGSVPLGAPGCPWVPPGAPGALKGACVGLRSVLSGSVFARSCHPDAFRLSGLSLIVAVIRSSRLIIVSGCLLEPPANVDAGSSGAKCVGDARDWGGDGRVHGQIRLEGYMSVRALPALPLLRFSLRPLRAQAYSGSGSRSSVVAKASLMPSSMISTPTASSDSNCERKAGASRW